MKKLVMHFTLILTLLFVVGSTMVFADNYREVIFGNNWANINEITNDELMTAYKNCRYVKVYNRNHFNDFHLYEEKYGEEGNPGYDTNEKETEASFYLWSDLQNDSYFEKKDDGIFYLVCDRGDPIIPDITIACSFPLIEAKHPFKYTLQNAFDANPVTSFVEDTEDNSIFIHLFPDSFPACKKVKLINGYAQNQQLYQNNNRVKSIADRKNTQKITLEDNTLESQIFDWGNYSVYSTDLYKGTKYNDTCIAELDFMTENGEWLFGNDKSK